jgi:hypothetical protein
MSRTALAEVHETLELGSMAILYRPRVEEWDADELADVQRFLILLRPEASAFERLIAVGRKPLPPSTRHDRFWGFVDLVLTPFDMTAALSAQVYNTKTRGLRHVPPAQAFAWGSYELSAHGDHGHLRWQLDRVDTNDSIADALDLDREADYVVSIANPDPAAWGLLEPPDLQGRLFGDLETHVTLPQPLPPSLQARFRGRRFAALDSAAWLDHPGAELLFAGAGE